MFIPPARQIEAEKKRKWLDAKMLRTRPERSVSGSPTEDKRDSNNNKIAPTKRAKTFEPALKIKVNDIVCLRRNVSHDQYQVTAIQKGRNGITEYVLIGTSSQSQLFVTKNEITIVK